ncbi:tRNA uridine-5-carboxymethylaminomethyl(34) synthesis GTPase MnmE [Sphingomonas sp. HF-S4]|uniref:tRNA modification GTPase MnmE n=1 Tax=Sphingomonas agrestis TaxID=3080540 RepID=A0ABU3YB30_9SPHN|nr:tRNA uridine-5-carboxymethylaminomethyl(34) synthesis GTPase MnmE [Sphingomonas sp. HF-S4]MDV3458600.1 tRNA uridine-5-carboxymethylaminomethyl(34) synthesis GTPase MnmE [Sphingomonas sp. HF-S4]
MDTIFAVSSGAPPAAIAVLRLSGPQAFEAAEALAGTLPQPRRAGLRALRDSSGELLDRALVLTFPGPDSASGEDLVELHLHGGRAVVRAVQAALGAIEGLRPAEAGEFTRRALLNGRMDLSEAEGLGDLLIAETEAQRRIAVRAAEGGVRRQVEAWAQRLLGLAAQVEAQLDHSDEDDVADGADSLAALHAAAAALARDIADVASRPPVERLRDGLRVVLAGPPNAGKSTLLNAMVEREAAIVSPIAGTTRDRIEAPVTRGGTAWLLIDTAGLAETTADPIEAIGITRARAALDEADIVLWLGDDAPPPHPALLWLLPRADMVGRESASGERLVVSGATGAGIDALWAALDRLASALLPQSDMLALNRRQRDLAEAAGDALGRAAMQHDLLLYAEELRSARRSFDAITGRVGVESMLDALFSRFCIGK